MSKAPSLTKAERRQVEAIEAVLKPWSLGFRVVPGQPHKSVVVTTPLGDFRVTFASTPRDADRAVDMSRQKAQRLSRQLMDRCTSA